MLATSRLFSPEHLGGLSCEHSANATGESDKKQRSEPLKQSGQVSLHTSRPRHVPNAIQNKGLSKVCLRVVLSVFDIRTICDPNTLKSQLTSQYNVNRLLMNFHSYCKQETSNNNNNKEALTAFLNRLFVVTTGVSNFRIQNLNTQRWSHAGHTSVTLTLTKCLKSVESTKITQRWCLRQTTVLAMEIYKRNGSGGGTRTPDTRIMIPLL